MPDNELEYETFVRKPFTVEAVLITKDNIEQVAREIGWVREDSETREPYIAIDPKVIPNIPIAYLGFYMTKMIVRTKQGEFTNYRCYAGKAFDHQFVPIDETVQKWMDYLEKSSKTRKATPPKQEASAEDMVADAFNAKSPSDDEDIDYNLVSPSAASGG